MMVKILKRIKQWCFVLLYSCLGPFPKSLNKAPRNINVVISLTSFPARFGMLHLVLESLFRQSCKADAIELYLDDNVDLSLLPRKITRLQQYGLKIIGGGEDIKPHKKYYYAMQRHPDDIVLTVDDDNIYTRDTVRKLYECHQLHPRSISSMRVHQIKFDVNKKVLSYNDWNLNCYAYIQKPRNDLMATGVGGVLYPPHLFSEELFSLQAIRKTSLHADDIWLKFMQLKDSISVVMPAINTGSCVGLPTRCTGALSAENVECNRNDTCIQAIMAYYQMSDSDFYGLCTAATKEK